MKFSRTLVIAVGVVAIAASTIWYLRNTLIQKISNPLLQDFGITVTDVSLDALAVSDATIGYLELTHDKGTRIVFENLTLPVRTSSTGLKTYVAEKVSVITATSEDDEPLEFAQLIDQILQLYDNLGSSEFVVGEINLPPYPKIRDLRWTVAEGEQTLTATIESVPLSTTIIQTDVARHTVNLSLPNNPGTTSGHSITANLQRTDQTIGLNGSSSIDLAAWEPLARLAGIVPHGISFQSGTATIQFAVEIPYDAMRSATVAAELVPSSSVQLVYSEIPGEITTITMQSGGAVTLAATFPDVTWSLQQPQASLLVSQEEWVSIPLAVSELYCEPGPVCSLNTRIEMNNAVLPFGTTEQINFSSTEKLIFLDEGLRVEVQPDATLNITGLATPDVDVKRLTAKLASSASIELIDAGWRLAADSLDASIDAMSLSDDLWVTAPLFFENLLVSEIDDVLSARAVVYAPSSQATWNKQVIKLPGIKGELSQQIAKVEIDLQTVGLHSDAGIKALLNLDNGSGQLFVADMAVSLDTHKLSSRIAPWDDAWDIAAGIVFIDIQADWTQSGSGLDASGQTTARIENLSGHYGDTVFVGLSTTLEATYESEAGFAATPSSFTLALIDMGLALENISADYTLYPDVPAIDMKSLQMAAFGGTIRADPFSFRTDRSSNTLVLHGESIELDALLTLKEFEAIEVSGTIGARLPVTIEGETVTIVNGTLTGEAPGGVIRYLPGLDPDGVDTSSIGLVTRALSNFEYKTLTSEVEYSKDGDLNLQLHLTGRNPDLDENRPVVLNLGVENNVPQMLKSLQAARAVEEILEKRLNK